MKEFTIGIRRARSVELQTLTDIALRSKESNGYDDDFMQACQEELTVTEQQLNAGEYWVAEGPQICGFVCLRAGEGGKVGDIEAFFIDPEFQRQGIGRLLWEKLLERADLNGHLKLRLAADPAAVGFYEKLGFTVTGQIPSGSIPGRSLPLMMKTL